MGELMGGERVYTINEDIVVRLDDTKIIIEINDKRFLLYNDS